MRADIAAAAIGCDYDRLGELAGVVPAEFVFSEETTGDAGAFMEELEGYGAETLKGLVEILATPVGSIPVPGLEPLYVWPSAFAYGSWSQVPEAERDAIRPWLGPSVAMMEELDSYLGPRIGITESGDWIFYSFGDIPTGDSGSSGLTGATGAEADWVEGALVAVDFDPAATYSEKLVEVRTGEHAGYTRVVFEFTPDGVAPSFLVGFMNQPFFDPAGQEVSVSGVATLYVSMFPARRVDFEAAGQPATYTGPLRFDVLSPILIEAAFISDFEATMEWLIGVNRTAPIRVFTLAAPPRLVIDVATAAHTVACSAAGMASTPIDQAGLPDPVRQMREAIVSAATACDFAGLGDLALLGSTDFEYSFGPTGDPQAYWQQEEDAGMLPPLRLLVQTLDLPYAETAWGASGETIFMWPSAYVTDWAGVSDAEKVALRAMVGEDEYSYYETTGEYLGPRVGIVENGDWWFFIAGGD